MVKRRPRVENDESLTAKKICGYTAITPNDPNLQTTHGWLYLRRHSDTQLFLANLPVPYWLPSTLDTSATAQSVPQKSQQALKDVLLKMFPSSTSIDDLFSIRNGALGARLSIKGGKPQINKILQSPNDTIYLSYWTQFIQGDQDMKKVSIMERWRKEETEKRDEGKVLKWCEETMKVYEEGERIREEKRKERERMKDMEDEDGFVTVVSGAKQMKMKEMMKLQGKSKKTKTKKKHGMQLNGGIVKSGFYKWQRENENKLVDLQNKFRQDQKRMEQIRRLDN